MASQIKSKVEEYTLTLNKSTLKVFIHYKGKQCGMYSTKIFKRDGMKVFPKRLYKLICNDLKYANIYDRFLDKFYTWDELDE